jgi:hypothetical protein
MNLLALSKLGDTDKLYCSVLLGVAVTHHSESS